MTVAYCALILLRPLSCHEWWAGLAGDVDSVEGQPSRTAQALALHTACRQSSCAHLPPYTLQYLPFKLYTLAAARRVHGRLRSTLLEP